jgi:hypothetical protein
MIVLGVRFGRFRSILGGADSGAETSGDARPVLAG